MMRDGSLAAGLRIWSPTAVDASGQKFTTAPNLTAMPCTNAMADLLLSAVHGWVESPH